MGQTLTHGVYLPDEGERNCYSGLAANWQLLDNSVGTIAEHSTQIAGKAPAVHTHTKADITDFPIYGTTAGTICEGNDSRLSDARTPLSHTHYKANITDLFNSANEWTANNYFPLRGFYLRGFSARASTPASNEFSQYSIADTNNNPLMSINSANRATGVRDLTFRVYTNDGGVNGVGVFKDAANSYSFCSVDPNNAIDLGTSTNKWKTLNGVNPGALSFPKIGTTENVDFINVLGNIDASVTSAQTFVAPATGWFCITFKYNEVTACRISAGQLRADCVPMGSNDYVGCYIPVTEGVTVTVILNATAIYRARIYLCQGNV